MPATKRNIDLVVLSDVHLGTHGCKSKELVAYMRSIAPARVIVNGDLIDIWQLRKSFWPPSHMQVIHQLLRWARDGVKVEYVCGNHDEFMRRFIGYTQGNLSIVNQVVLEQNGKKVWVFHGDALDGSMKNKALAKWGGRWYDRSVRLNNFLNRGLVKLGMKPRQISKALKDGVKAILNKKHDWQGSIANAAIEAGYDMVMVGHNHKPEIREIETPKGSLMYLNSGDWMENLTSLEYNAGRWVLFTYGSDMHEIHQQAPVVEDVDPFTDEIVFAQLLKELGLEAIKA